MFSFGRLVFLLLCVLLGREGGTGRLYFGGRGAAALPPNIFGLAKVRMVFYSSYLGTYSCVYLLYMNVNLVN